MKGKCFMLGAAITVVGKSACFADFIAEKIIDPESGLQTVVTIDASKGKDAFIYRYDKKSQKFYMDKVEKNKPSDEDKSDNDRVISAGNGTSRQAR